VLLHPSDNWVREWSVRLGTTALSPGVEFREGVGFALLAARANSGDAGARATLDDGRATVVEATDMERDDAWSLNRRRVGVLAEVYAWLDGERAGAGLLAGLLSRLWLPTIGTGGVTSLAELSPEARQRTQRGFAGFRAPALLSLAETAEIVGIPEVSAELVSEALRGAHNVQDPVFCARSTARVETLRRNWSPGVTDLAATVERLRKNPSAAEFATVHRVGEQYEFRDAHPNDLPASLLEARSCSELSVAFGRPLADVLRVNGASPETADTPLPVDALALIPDPGFIPLLAARLAATALCSSLSAAQRVSVIQALVPLATANLTALDTVLTRLLRAGSFDAADLDRIAVVVGGEQPGMVNPSLPRIAG
jgi:hypothetical protein